MAYENDLNLKATELRLGLPGIDGCEDHALFGAKNKKRPTLEKSEESESKDAEAAPPAK